MSHPGIADSALNSMADHYATLATHLQLHTTDPGATGVTGATAHARVAASWPAATNGGDLAITNKAFTGGAANGAVTWVSAWSASTAGTFRGAWQIPNNGTNDLTSNGLGQYTITSMTITGS